MQYVRKEDVFNQDMSVKTMVYQASTLFSSLYLYYLIYVIYISYIYIIHYHLSLFSFLFLKTTITKVRTLVLYFIGTYMYRRNLSTCSLSFILDVALIILFDLRQDAPKIVLLLEIKSYFLCKNKQYHGANLFRITKSFIIIRRNHNIIKYMPFLISNRFLSTNIFWYSIISSFIFKILITRIFKI